MTSAAPKSADELHKHYVDREPQMLSALKRLVEIESPSEDIPSLDRCASAIQEYANEELGGSAEIVRAGPQTRPNVVARFGERIDVLFIGHFDTVYPLGSIDETPFRVDNSKAYGAGILDMKAGLVIMTEVAKYVLGENPDANLCLFFNSDEELASVDSRTITEELCEGAQLVVVFEYTTEEAEVKIGSRGNNPYRITIKGRGGHAAYPEQLSNPIDALYEVMEKLRPLNQPERGQVVVPTVIRSGARTNVVPESAYMELDVRFSHESTVEKVEQTLRSIRFNDPDLTMTYEAIHTMPLHKADPNSYAFKLAKDCAIEFGLELQGIEARGGSDLNHVGPVNPNVIEALGAVGGGAHSAEREFLYVSSLARRAALTTMMTERALADAAE